MNEKVLDTPAFNVLMFSITWALQIFFSKLAYKAGAQPVTFLIQNACVMGIVLAIYVLPQKLGELKKMRSKLFWGLMLANAIHFGFGAFFGNAGISLTYAVNAGFLLKFATVTTIFLAWIFLKEKLTLPKIVAAIMMFIGIFLISTKGQLIVPQIGDLLLILACLSWSTANILIRKVLRDNPVSGEVVAFLRPIAGLPMLFLFILLSPLYPTEVREVFTIDLSNLTYIHYVVVTGILAAGLTIFLNRTLKIATASYMSMMSMLTPIIVTALAILFLDEELAFVQMIGTVLIISAGMITHYIKVDKQ